MFDGPHFVSYRMAQHGHVLLLKVPGDFVFVIAAHKDDDAINDLKNVAGPGMCTPAPPNLGALTALAQFDNPRRQPRLVDTKSFPHAYEGLRNNKCAAPTIQIKILEKLDVEHKIAKVLFKSKSLPTQTISVSPRLSDAERAQLAEALLSDAGQQATKKLREEYNVKDFVPAKADEYEPHYTLLKDVWGFQVAAR